MAQSGDPTGVGAVARLLQESAMAIPVYLLTWYKEIGMYDQELALILHLVYMKERENTVFPTYTELARRMTATEDEIAGMVQRLIGHGLLDLQHRMDEHTGTWQDSYDLSPLFMRLARVWLERHVEQLPRPWATADVASRLFRLFEEEFGRPLSAIEIEQLIQWLDQDAYPEWMIQEALREAVLSGTLSLRYIDRILLEWQKKNIRSPRELHLHRQQFQQRRRPGREGAKTARKAEPGFVPGEDSTQSKYEAFYKLYKRDTHDSTP
ncbi:DnaD domain-containing protein [Kyrpidia tusciae]|uniref:Primosome, DnaD subunit n=1 Tax=Kyrpidia tusciae (strain DSM 2912 / NBRC 15312 / T2) TaxID=562970 RepID=D5WPX5_KYRT2|nr:DnaD domain protein [Kyrpidia tusciae]ADG06384.1 primosome, DnaD subunit [Kyrpidia tusciae DSM 2912]